MVLTKGIKEWLTWFKYCLGCFSFFLIWNLTQEWTISAILKCKMEDALKEQFLHFVCPFDDSVPSLGNIWGLTRNTQESSFLHNLFSPTQSLSWIQRNLVQTKDIHRDPIKPIGISWNPKECNGIEPKRPTRLMKSTGVRWSPIESNQIQCDSREFWWVPNWSSWHIVNFQCDLNWIFHPRVFLHLWYLGQPNVFSAKSDSDGEWQSINLTK